MTNSLTLDKCRKEPKQTYAHCAGKATSLSMITTGTPGGPAPDSLNVNLLKRLNITNMAFKDTAIYYCTYCGERLTGKAKYCKGGTDGDGNKIASCSTQKGRKQVFDLNVAIFKEMKAKGHAVPDGIKNWK